MNLVITLLIIVLLVAIVILYIRIRKNIRDKKIDKIYENAVNGKLSAFLDIGVIGELIGLASGRNDFEALKKISDDAMSMLSGTGRTNDLRTVLIIITSVLPDHQLNYMLENSFWRKKLREFNAKLDQE